MPMSPRLLRPRAPSGFNPRTIAGLSAWYDASLSNSITLETGVRQWNDLSGNSYHLTQTTTNNQPGYTGSIGGKSAINFDGSNDTLSTAGNVAVVAADVSFTVFVALTVNGGVVVTQDDFAGNPRAPIFLRAWTGTSPSRTMRTVVYDSANVTLGAISGSVVADNTPYVMTASYEPGSSNIWINGGSTGTSAITAASSAHLKKLWIGSLGGANNFMAGTIGEIVIYNRALNTASLNTVNRYLGRKWGVTVA